MALTRGGFRHYDFDLMVVLLTMTNAATEVAYAISSCAYRKSNPAILMVQSAWDWTADDASDCLSGA
jgi:hypothetical protein